MNTLPTLFLETSSIHGGIDLRRDGIPVDLETALRDGFTVTKDDAHVILSLVSRFLQNRDANHG